MTTETDTAERNARIAELEARISEWRELGYGLGSRYVRSANRERQALLRQQAAAEKRERDRNVTGREVVDQIEREAYL